jgi:colanic acid biosynthesis protein WcaH
MQQTLTPEEFLAVVDKTPLVSIDLVVRDQQRRVLLGIRVNEPARGFWFVPGGRIMKGETLDEAFSRISIKELGVHSSLANARLLGAFTHQYDTNFAGIPEIGTHYVVLAYELELELALDFDQIPQLEHSNYRWWTSSEAARSKDVHPNNLPYFLHSEGK